VAEDVGARAVALHARTASQLYSGRADWSAIAALKQHLTIPVLGNGDIWEAEDALAMMRVTGADGVVIGRGCLGRPWLFGDLVDAFEGRPPKPAPHLGQVLDVLVEHGHLLAALRGEEAGLRELRKHTSWYLTGYPVGAAARRQLAMISSLDELETITASLDRDLTAPTAAIGAPRGTQSGPQQVTLPDGWLNHRHDLVPPPAEADVLVSGG